MNCILKRKRLLVIFQNRSVNDLIQGELYKYHLLADYNPEQAAGGSCREQGRAARRIRHPPNVTLYEYKAVKEHHKIMLTLIKGFNIL